MIPICELVNTEEQCLSHKNVSFRRLNNTYIIDYSLQEQKSFCFLYISFGIPEPSQTGISELISIRNIHHLGDFVG